MTISDEIRAHFASRTVEEELRDSINRAVWHAAYRTLGLMEITPCNADCCTAEQGSFDVDAWRAQREDRDVQLRVHLEALRLAVEVAGEANPVGWIGNARKVGATWQQIADTLGVNRQAARKRFARFADAYSGNDGE